MQINKMTVISVQADNDATKFYAMHNFYNFPRTKSLHHNWNPINNESMAKYMRFEVI